LINFLTPEIFSTYEKFRQKNCKFPYTIFLSSILFEKKWNLYNNYNINVFKPELLRKKFILSKSTIDINMLEYVLENEMSEYYKNSKSNFIIHNYSEKNLDFKIDNEIIQIHSNLLRHCQNLDLEETF
jgi:dephospho-CoA kinase